MRNINVLSFSKEEIKELISEVIDEKFKKFNPLSFTKTENEYLTIKETAKILSITTVTLYQWRKSDKIKGYRIGTTSRVRFKRKEVEELLIQINS